MILSNDLFNILYLIGVRETQLLEENNKNLYQDRYLIIKLFFYKKSYVPLYKIVGAFRLSLLNGELRIYFQFFFFKNFTKLVKSIIVSLPIIIIRKIKINFFYSIFWSIQTQNLQRENHQTIV